MTKLLFPPVIRLAVTVAMWIGFMPCSSRASDTFANTGSLNIARENHTATLLPNGKVLVAGGYDYNNGNAANSGTIGSAELYDPATGAWTATGSLATARYDHTATLLPNDKVLVAGGRKGSTYFTTAELYDPATGAWTAAGSLATGRRYHTATLLPDGKVLIAGGFHNSSLASAELYDPATGVWTATGSLATARDNHTATLLPNGKVLVAGGRSGSGFLSTAELYNPAAGTWTATGSLVTTHASHTATLLTNGKVLVAGGNLSTNFSLSSAELYDPSSGVWSATGSLTSARGVHTATLLPNGKVLAVGGFNDSYLADAELYDPAVGTWTATASLVTGRGAHTATLLATGKVLVAAGYHSGFSSLASAELYDTADTNNIRPTATIVVADTALRVGGTSLVTFTFSEAVTGFTNADLSIANGTLDSLNSADGGLTWTANLTPLPKITVATNHITLDNTGVFDALGDTGVGISESNNYSIDTEPPGLLGMTRLDPSPTNSKSLRYSVIFTEPVSGLDGSDFGFFGEGVSPGFVTKITEITPESYIVRVTGMSGSGRFHILLLGIPMGKVYDLAGNPLNFVPTFGTIGRSSPDYQVDLIAPTVIGVTVPANGIYTLDKNMDFTVKFSENVVVNSTGGKPGIPLAFDFGGTGYADYLSGSGSGSLVFRATVVNGQADTNGISLDSSIDLNGGTLRDAFGNDAVLTLNSVGSTASVLVDAIPPVVVGSGIPDQTLQVGGATKTLTLSSFFADIGSSSMTYTVVSNSDATKASATISTNKIMIAPIANGVTNVVVKANDGHGGTITDTFLIAVGTTRLTTTQPVTKGIGVTSQTGLFDVTVKVTNTTPLPINGFRLHVNFNAYKAAFPSLRLYNASSPPGASDVYVNFPYPVAVDAVVAIKLSFYTSTRTFPSPFKPVLSVEMLQASQVPDTHGNGVQPRLVRLADKTVLLEFPSQVGKWYRVRYSADMVHWFDCPAPIQAGNSKMQWIDSGPPFTNVPPASAPSRFYIVNKIAAP